MTREQNLSAVRWLVTTFGAFIAGFFAARGWISYDAVIGILNSESFIGMAATVLTLIWGLFAHTQGAAVAAVASIPEVSNHALAQAVGPKLAVNVPKV